MRRPCPQPRTSCSPFSIACRSGIAPSAIRRCSPSRNRAACAGKSREATRKTSSSRTRRGALLLVVALEDAAIDLKSLHRRLGAGRFSFGSPDLLRETLGIEPGAVTPFAAINDIARRVEVVLDQAMLSHDTLNCHPLVNTMTTAIGREDLVRFLEATGHPPRIALVSAGMTQ
jgi:Ala-tRNA(Pro) deacylase